ncbi:hypothetical protein A3A38_00845 [Candidatus Kaiserbacteria bacterium RIFCSPLOWO2_01_FULL_53_17]|uniref:DUF5671 domain-containing protein n=1 Tax=Candidatus Kaiserbacteria bacterium RIFCSPLOWO2_01_FULL_53_17 TaxID=1798511 RepID=A0A1F6EGE0_9BACT|nr:MAG: hypothetical protein A3A38_00845 [Candidatus Kaiserbacteria bacterium RIFCSPLOWO2_01_FULL_53_17]
MNTPKVTPKDFFLWVGAMAALYGSVVAFIALLFEYINYAFPDPLTYYVTPYSGSIRFEMAALIVLVPVMLFLMRLIRNDIARIPEKADLWVRRWVLFLTVFIAGVAVIGDLITLINYFLGGDLTMRFIMKVGVVLLVAGGVFLHFLADLRGYWNQNPARARMMGWAAAAVVLISIIAGFFIMGTPGQVRLYRFDEQKVSDLQNIQWQVVNYYQQKEKVPANVSELADPLSGWTLPVDPQTGENYTYEKTGNLSFRLCATFNAESQGPGDSSVTKPMYASVEGENWQHGEGEVCFDRTIDPDRYPPYEKSAIVPIR